MRFFAVLLVCLSSLAVLADDFPVPDNTEPLSTDTLLSPEEAARQFQLPEGFRVSVFAGEPDVQNPIAMSWDQKGRLWVAENYTYAQRSQRFRLDLRDRVVIFDNTTGDHFKKRTVFTDNVQMLTGIAVGRGGVWLMCPPKLMFIPDADGDDVPDGEGEVVLDGFTVAQNNYHNFANGLKFGPDGWLYGRCGGSCPGRIGVPGTADENRLAMEGGIWRYHPTRKQVEVLTSGTTNPWGHDWNGVGEMFYCNTVNGHLWHMMPGAHFTRPFLLDPNRRTYKLIDFHADHWHFDTGQSWTKSRDGAALEYGGGHAHIGTMIYQGQNWPSEYRGKLFTLNQHGRRANQEILERSGSGYVAKHGKDTLISKDIWFQGIDLDSGPDGGVFVLDWSDTGECHEHTGVHRTSGRIYKVTYGDERHSGVSDLSKLPFNERVKLLTDENVWLRRQARLSLVGVPRKVSVTKLNEVISRADATSTERVQALFAINALGQASKSFWERLLSNSDEHVRCWAIRFLTEDWPIDDTLGAVWKPASRVQSVKAAATDLLPMLKQMAKTDDSSLVRLTLASTLQRLPVSMRAELAAELVKHPENADDHNLPMMIWYGLIPVARENAESLADVAVGCELPDTLRCIARCLAEEIERHPGAIDRLLKHVAESSDIAFQQTVLSGMEDGLQGWAKTAKPAAWDHVVALGTPELSNSIRQLSVVFGDGRAMDDLKAIALGKTESDPLLRLDALRTLISSQPDDLRAICEELLTDNRMNVAAAQGLAKFDDEKIGEVLVKRYRKFRAPFRPQVISILSSRKSFAAALLTAMKEGKIPREDLSAFQVRQIQSLGDGEISSLVREVWGEVRDTSAEKKQTIAKLKHSLTSEVLQAADRSNGRKLFTKACQNCHRLYGEGGKVGPDLTGSNRDNMDYLLGNIVDPSGVVDKDFRMTLLMLTDGRVISGMVTDETDRIVSIQTATEALKLEKDTIEQRKITDQSPMPAGLLDNLTDKQIRDLISYLAHPTQVE
jgi:putative membrane-bound dehydrogenase-like protein